MATNEYQQRRYANAKIIYAEFMKTYPLTLENFDGEQWKWIPGYEDLYQESTFGRTKSFQYKTPRIMRPQLTGQGYLSVGLHKNNQTKIFMVHRLVARCFIPNTDEKPAIDHIDGQPFNNHVSNLRWVSNLENNRHSYELGFKQSGEDNSRAVLTNEQVEWCRKVYKPRDKDFGATALARKFGVKRHVITFAVRGKTYKNAKGDVYKGDTKILPPDIRKKIKSEYQRGVKGYGYVSLARKYGVAHTTIKTIVNEK